MPGEPEPTVNAALPIDAHLDRIAEQLAESGRLVLEAEPGAGKSTRVPPELESRGPGSVLLLEPRRIAARNLATFLARQRGEKLGDSVGLSVRLERRVSARTRLEVLTEGVLTRRIQRDPELTGVAAIVFDEFHERHLQGDLALALAREVQATLRPDLKLLIMSATLDGPALAQRLAAPHLAVPGRCHPLELQYRPGAQRQASAAEMAKAARALLDDGARGVLVFAPGVAEIQRIANLLAKAGMAVRALHGEMSLDQQAAALRPDGEGPRVVVATNIAESSLTVPAIDAVVDSGLARVPRFDPESGLTRLQTRRISAASADQRAGRAGREGPGRVLRLWSADERLVPRADPEILSADLAGLALELALWGDSHQLHWLDPPPDGALAQARDLLAELGLLDTSGRITALGRRAARFGTHPRLAAMMASDEGPLAADLAALLEGRDPLPRDERSDDVLARIEALNRWRRNEGRRPGGPWARIDQQARRWHEGPRDPAPTADIGGLIARAYPDRIALAREEQGNSGSRFRLSGGGGARLRPDSALTGQIGLAVCGLLHREGDRLITLAAPLGGDGLEQRWAETGQHRARVDWDSEGQRVEAWQERCLGALVLDRKPLADPDPEQVAAILIQAVARRGVARLNWTPGASALRQRVAFCRHHHGHDWPDWTDPALEQGIERWLGPHLAGLTRLAQVDALDLGQVLMAGLDYRQRQALDRLAPQRCPVPSGRQAAIDYSDPAAPVLAVKLQELFGLEHTPRVGGVALTVHLLSPAGRPLQITRDLAHFWRNGYGEVRKEMRGRYPKHPWPEDPLAAEPTARTKKRRP